MVEIILLVVDIILLVPIVLLAIYDIRNKLNVKIERVDYDR